MAKIQDQWTTLVGADKCHKRILNIDLLRFDFFKQHDIKKAMFTYHWPPVTTAPFVVHDTVYRNVPRALRRSQSRRFN